MKQYKKAIIIFCAFAVIVGVVFAIRCLKKPRMHNVFDQMCYEMFAAEEGKNSVFLLGPSSVECEYDFGVFMGVKITKGELKYYIDCKQHSSNMITFPWDDSIITELTISIYDPNKELCPNTSNHYSYRLDERKVYLGVETSFDPLLEVFLPDYFKWYSDSGKENPYSINDLGDVTFEESEQQSIY